MSRRTEYRCYVDILIEIEIGKLLMSEIKVNTKYHQTMELFWKIIHMELKQGPLINFTFLFQPKRENIAVIVANQLTKYNSKSTY